MQRGREHAGLLRRRLLQGAPASVPLAYVGELTAPFQTAWAVDAKLLIIALGSDIGSVPLFHPLNEGRTA